MVFCLPLNILLPDLLTPITSFLHPPALRFPTPETVEAMLSYFNYVNAPHVERQHKEIRSALSGTRFNTFVAALFTAV